MDEDQEYPVAIRCRHLRSIYKAICRHIDGFGLLLPSTENDANDLEESAPPSAQSPADIVRLKATAQTAIAVSLIPPPQKPQKAATTLVPKPKSMSQATTECSTPSLPIPTLPHANDYNTYANFVPGRRSRSKTYTSMMPSDDPDSPDESGDFEALSSSPDTP